MNQVRETRLLGVIVSDNLKWHSNTASLVTRCYQRMTILRNLNTFHVPVGEMVNIYCMYIRSVAEQSSVVWSSSITSGEEYDIERVQKVALRVILKENYVDYRNALYLTSDLRTKDMFPLKTQIVETRNPEKYEVTKAKTNRLAKSAIPTMQRQLNRLNSKK